MSKPRSLGWLGAMWGAVLLVAFGCSSGGGGGVGIGSLEGEWFGAGDDIFGNIGTFFVTFDSAGAFTGNTTIGDDFTGTAKHESGRYFSYRTTDGTVGLFMVDSSAHHLAGVDEDFTFAMLEKDALALPDYVNVDVVGSWGGFELETTDFVTFTAYENSLKVAPTFSVDGETKNPSNPAFDGDFAVFSTAFGIYLFTGTSGNVSMGGQAYVGADKSALGSWTCRVNYVYPDDCTFSIQDKTD